MPTPTAPPAPPDLTRTPVPHNELAAGLRFAAIGDFGTGGANQAGVAGRMCRVHVRRPFDVVVTTGDNVYPSGSRDRFQAAFFTPYRCLLNAGVPFHSALGNHDVMTRNGSPELREPAFGMARRNYVLRSGAVRFVIADSNALDESWLADALAPRAGDRWTIVVFHHPVFSPGAVHGSTPGLRPWMPRLFHRKGVDLVLNGHEHLYAVSKRVRGVRYVVTGGGGASLYGCADAWFSVYCSSQHHFLEVVAAPEHIEVRAVPARGRAFHSFRIPSPPA